MTASDAAGANGRYHPRRGRLAARLADPFDRIYGRSCETCGAAPGRLCVTKRGGSALLAHTARVVTT